MGSCNSAPPRPEAVCRRNSPSGEPSPRASSRRCAPPARRRQAARRASPNPPRMTSSLSPTKRRRCAAANISTSSVSLRCGGCSSRRSRTSSAKAGLRSRPFCNSRDSRWRLVGRVHFNLAENRKDAERPVRLPGDLRLVARGARRASPSRARPCVARIRRRRRKDRASQAARAGQPCERKLRVAEGDRRLGRDLSSRCAGRRKRRCGCSPTSRRWSGPASSCACRPRGA